MHSSATRLLLPVPLTIGLTGCYIRPYWHDDLYDDGYGYGYGNSYYPSNSILLRGGYIDDDYDYDRYHAYRYPYPKYVPHHQPKHKQHGRKHEPGTHRDRRDGLHDRAPHRYRALKFDRRRPKAERENRSRRHDGHRINRTSERQTRKRFDRTSQQHRATERRRVEHGRRSERMQPAEQTGRAQWRQRQQRDDQASGVGENRRQPARNARSHRRERRNATTAGTDMDGRQ